MNYSNLIEFLRNRACEVIDVDLATDSTTAVNAACEVLGYWVNIVMSAHACPILDGATTKLTLPASSAAGVYIQFPAPVRFGTSLVVDPNDAATGHVAFFYRLL